MKITGQQSRREKIKKGFVICHRCFGLNDTLQCSLLLNDGEAICGATVSNISEAADVVYFGNSERKETIKKKYGTIDVESKAMTEDEFKLKNPKLWDRWQKKWAKRRDK